MQNAGASVPNDKGGSRRCALRNFASDQLRGGSHGQAGVRVRAVHERGLSAVLSPRLEGIDRGDFGTNRQVASRAGTREGSPSRSSARGAAGFSGPKGARSLIQRRVSPAVVPEWDFQTRTVGRACAQQSGSRTEDSEK